MKNIDEIVKELCDKLDCDDEQSCCLHYDCDGVFAKELSTLIQKERKEAVRGFIEWYGWYGKNYPDGVWLSEDVIMDEYLSQTKGGRE